MDQIRTVASQIWTAAGIAIKIVRAVMTAFSQSIVAVCRSVAFDGDPQAVRSIAAGPLADGDVVCHALPRLSAQPAPGGHQPFACCCSSLLIVFLDSALRLHAAHRAYVANIHEMGCDGRAFLGLHRPITAGTSNDRKFAQVAYHRWAAPWVLA